MAAESMQHRAVVVTALSLECKAVCKYLANRHQVTHPLGTVYERGSFVSESGCEWDVLVIECGAGNVTAAAEVERAFSFFQPEIALFVGIAGGLKDVRIGDVVVGTKIYAYESGKEKEEFETRPEVHLPSYRLAQRAKAEIRSGQWVNRIQAEMSSGPAKAFAGPIASGEKVIASSVSVNRSLLKDRYGDALAVEMEGYGFLRGVYLNSQLAALVVRGISDLIEGKETSDAGGSQERAAEAASAFAFEMLAHLEPESGLRVDKVLREGSARAVFKPDPQVAAIISNVKLGDWKAAARAALKIVNATDPASGENHLFQSLLSSQDSSDESDLFWGATQTLECCVRIAPWLITREQLSRMAQHSNYSVRASAASICMDMAHSSSALVPLDIVMKLSVHDEDWYVQAPANAALKAMARFFPGVLAIFFERLHSRSADERAHAAHQIESISKQDAELLDREELEAELARLRELNDVGSADAIKKALSKTKGARPRYRYGL
jgi:nucleoside phosphorylase